MLKRFNWRQQLPSTAERDLGSYYLERASHVKVGVVAMVDLVEARVQRGDGV
jgi:hypothetical protein